MEQHMHVERCWMHLQVHAKPTNGREERLQVWVAAQAPLRYLHSQIRVTMEDSVLGAETGLYPHGRAGARRQGHGGATVIVHVNGSMSAGQEAVERGACLPLPKALDVALREGKKDRER